MDFTTQIESQLSIKTAGGSVFLNDCIRAAAYAKNIALLNAISETALTALFKNAKTLSYPKRATIVSEGAKADAFYIVLAGKVRLFVSDDEGKQVTLNIQHQGTYFGEVALLLAGESMLASAMALEKTVCAVISKDDFILWLIDYPEAAFILLSSLSSKIKQLTDKVKQMTLLDTYGCMIALLEGLATEEGDVSVIYNKPSQKTLASMVGSSRKTVNKIMCHLIRGGYVSVNHNNLLINQKLPEIW